MRRTAVGLVLAVAIAVFGWMYWFVRIHGFSAREQPSSIEAFLARRIRGLAIPSSASGARNPLEPSPLNVAEGRDHFADHCATCHANDGSGRTQINKGPYPPAPDMRGKVTQDLTDGEVLYIIQNGVRFTGMPGWGGGAEENWKLVLLIRHLPEITTTELDLMEDVNGLTSGQNHDHQH